MGVSSQENNLKLHFFGKAKCLFWSPFYSNNVQFTFSYNSFIAKYSNSRRRRQVRETKLESMPNWWWELISSRKSAWPLHLRDNEKHILHSNSLESNTRLCLLTSKNQSLLYLTTHGVSEPDEKR